MKNTIRFVFSLGVCFLFVMGVWSSHRGVSAGSEGSGIGPAVARPAAHKTRSVAGRNSAIREKPKLDAVLRSYSSLRLDPKQLVAQARRSEKVVLAFGNRLMEIALQLHSLRGPNYTAMEIQADGSRRILQPRPVATWRGTVVGMPRAEARFTMNEKTLEGIVFDDDDWYVIEPLNRYDDAASPNEFITYRRTDLIEQSFGTCGTTLADEVGRRATGLTQGGKNAPTPALVQRSIEFATDADSEYVQGLGSSEDANAFIESTFNAIDGIYQQQLLLSLTIVLQVTRVTPEPYTATDPGALLRQVQTEWNTNFANESRDLVHMFTGKDLDGSLIGIAFVSVICRSPARSYGLSQYVTTAAQRLVLTAHEVGHNLGAAHPDQLAVEIPAGCATSIMNSNVTQNLTFCDYSRGEIATFLANQTNSECLTRTQDNCTFSTSPIELSFPADGGNGVVMVTTGAGCKWSTATRNPWLAVISPTGSTSGGGTVNFTVGSNVGGFARTGTIIMAGQIITINQGGTATTCPVTPITTGRSVSSFLSNGIISPSSCPETRVSQCGAGVRYYDAYQFSGVAGEKISITMSSVNVSVLDPYLYLVGPNGSVIAENDDLAAGNRNARIPATQSLTLPETGIYTVEATSCNPGGAGSYTILLRIPSDVTTPGQYRPSNGFVYLRDSNDTGIADTEFFYGRANDVPVAGDWNGDGVDSIGIYRDGTFFLRNSNTSGFADLQFPFGAPGDIPIAGDWDGDGIDTVGVVRGNTVFLRNSNTAGNADIQFNYGLSTDTFMTGDWDGDGRDTVGCYRQSTGFVYIRNSNTTGNANFEFFYGLAGDRPVVGDWNNDHVDTIGVVRGNQWFLRNSNSSGFADIQFFYGADTDTPIAGDWDGNP